MNILNQFQYAGAFLISLIVSVILIGILFISEKSRNIVMYYIGMQHQAHDYRGVINSPDGLAMYSSGPRDWISIVELMVVLILVHTFITDYICPYLVQGGVPSYSLCFNVTMGVFLSACLVMDIIVFTKAEYWTAFPLWWNGLPKGHIPCSVKCYCLVQLAVFCFSLGCQYFSGQNFATIHDEIIDDIVNLVFCLFCYIFNFVPLAMVILSVRNLLELLLLFHQILHISVPGIPLRLSHILSSFHGFGLLIEQVWLIILAGCTICFGKRNLFCRGLLSSIIGIKIATNCIFNNGNGNTILSPIITAFKGMCGSYPSAQGSAMQPVQGLAMPPAQPPPLPTAPLRKSSRLMAKKQR